MNRIKNIVLKGSNGRPMALDLFVENNNMSKPVVIYAHGFNGFKDWGNFDIIADQFASAGFAFVKFNFSHNGTTPAEPETFSDLEAFGQNNYSKQLEDLGAVIDWVSEPNNSYYHLMDSTRIFLVGHSMGGGITVLKAAEDKRVSKLVTWAGASECKTPWGNWPVEKMKEWKETGAQYYTNSRTNQQMPLYYQLYEDFIRNNQRLDIERAITGLGIPILICHGETDNAVPVEKAFELKKWQPAAKLFTISSDHVFGRRHPWTEAELPPAMQAVVNVSLDFLKSDSPGS